MVVADGEDGAWVAVAVAAVVGVGAVADVVGAGAATVEAAAAAAGLEGGR